MYLVAKVKTGDVKNNVVESHVSRIGVKGSSALDNGLSATYGLEYGLNMDGDDATSTLTARNTFVGVKGGFGEVRVGRHDTPAKLATAGQDVFADTYADMSNVLLADNLRVDNAVAYIGKAGPVGIAVAHTTSVGALPVGTWNGATVALGADDQAGNNLDANDLMVNYSNGPWYAGLGHTAVQDTLKNTNLGLGYKSEAGHAVNVVLETTKPSGGGESTKGTIVNGVYKMGNVSLKAQMGQSKTGSVNDKANAVGVDYSLGKKTSVYGLLAEQKPDGGTKSTASVVGLVTEF